MKKENRKFLCIAIGLLAVFVLWTVSVRFVDVQPIGPLGSSVGFATLNGFFHNLTGTHMSLYTITDWLGLVPIVVCMCFGILGLVQLIKRKSLFKIDYSIIALGLFYIIVIAVYVLFEKLAVNYRPVLINGVLEASYPSSTTMLVMCVMPTAIMQLKTRMKNNGLKMVVSFIITAFICFMVIGRLASGVHWVTDIIGGALLSGGLVTLYFSFTGQKNM